MGLQQLLLDLSKRKVFKGKICLLYTSDVYKRQAVVSMLCVILILPALFILCDKLICLSTAGMHIKTKMLTEDHDHES